MMIINFAHPLTDEQLAQLEALTGQSALDVRDEPTQTQIDDERPLLEQVVAIVDAFGLSPQTWQEGDFLVNLPWYAPATGAVLAELDGRIGHLPAIIRLRPVAGALPRRYEVAELVDLQAVRDAARGRR